MGSVLGRDFLYIRPAAGLLYHHYLHTQRNNEWNVVSAKTDAICGLEAGRDSLKAVRI